MEEEKKRKTLFIIVIILNIGIPVLIAFKDAAIGGFLFLIGILFVSRSYRILRADARRSYNPSVERIKADSAGRTILVQVVDDFGRELPPDQVEKLLAEAHARANPRDTIVPAKFKVDSKQPIDKS